MTAFSDFDAIKIGDRRELTKRITEDDIRRFVEMTGDDNPLHVDREFAAATAFKDVVVHGMLGASFISTVIGTKLPGPGALWISQNLEFLLPVRLGDELTVSCTVAKKHERDHLLELDTSILNQRSQTVLRGHGKVKMLEGRTQPAPAASLGLLSKVAIVTGGAGGIGESICRRLAGDGFKIILNYLGSEARARRIVAELVAMDADAIAVQADVSTPAGVQVLMQRATGAFGAPGVLINNASPPVLPKPLQQLGWNDLQHHLDVQLKGAFLLTQEVAVEMARYGAGRIVNVTSQVIQGTPTPHWTAYATAKAALAAFSKCIAGELGPSGVTVNCVAPGMTETGMIGDIAEKHQLMVARQTPLRRLAQPADVAAAVAFLVSDDARFITGHTINVNGGLVMS